MIPQGKGKLVMTGSLGDVISESADLALAVVRSRAATELPSGLNLNRLHEVDIHVSSASRESNTSADILIIATSSLGCCEEGWTQCGIGHVDCLLESPQRSTRSGEHGFHRRNHS